MPPTVLQPAGFGERLSTGGVRLAGAGGWGWGLGFHHGMQPNRRFPRWAHHGNRGYIMGSVTAPHPVVRIARRFLCIPWGTLTPHDQPARPANPVSLPDAP